MGCQGKQEENIGNKRLLTWHHCFCYQNFYFQPRLYIDPQNGVNYFLMLYMDKEWHQPKFAKFSFNFSIEDLVARATAASSSFFSPSCHPMTTLIGSLVTRLLWAGKMWGFGDRENKQGGVRDGERCVNGQVALSLPALFWDNRKNKERGVTDNWRQTATSGINGLVLGHALIQSRGGRGAGCLIMAFFPQFVA